MMESATPVLTTSGYADEAFWLLAEPRVAAEYDFSLGGADSYPESATPFVTVTGLPELISLETGRSWKISSEDIGRFLQIVSFSPTAYRLAFSSGEMTEGERQSFGGKLIVTTETKFTPRIGSDVGRHESTPLTQAKKAAEQLHDVARWLSVTLAEAAEMCGVSLRAAQYWSSGITSVPRASSVRRLRQVHAVLEALVKRLGRSGVTEWMYGPGEGEVDHLEVLRTEGPAALLRQAESIIFVPAPTPEPVLTDEDNEGWTAPYEKLIPHGRPPGPRKVPSDE